MTAAALRIHDDTRPAAVFLRRQPWFAGLDAAQQRAVADACSTLQGSKGEVMLHSGEPVQGWYAVLSGLVKLQGESAAGRRHCFLGIPGGEWFGEGSVMKKEPRMYDVIALRDTQLLCVPRARFEELRAGNLRFCQYLNEQFNMRLGQAMAIIEAMRLRTPAARVAMYLGPQLWHGSRKVSLSQEELGLLAALSRQTVNAVLKDFERRGLVSLEFGRVGIVDEAGLAAIVAAG